MRKQNERNRFLHELKRELAELGRSKPFRASSEAVNELLASLTTGWRREQESLQFVAVDLIKSAELIPLNASLLERALDYQQSRNLSFQDAVVFASVESHISAMKPERSCFLNRNSKDFDQPLLRERLAEFGCKFFPHFAHGLGYIRSQVRNNG